jgi:hypothetical protein
MLDHLHEHSFLFFFARAGPTFGQEFLALTLKHFLISFGLFSSFLYEWPKLIQRKCKVIDRKIQSVFEKVSSSGQASASFPLMRPSGRDLTFPSKTTDWIPRTC